MFWSQSWTQNRSWSCLGLQRILEGRRFRSLLRVKTSLGPQHLVYIPFMMYIWIHPVIAVDFDKKRKRKVNEKERNVKERKGAEIICTKATLH